MAKGKGHMDHTTHHPGMANFDGIRGKDVAHHDHHGKTHGGAEPEHGGPDGFSHQDDHGGPSGASHKAPKHAGSHEHGHSSGGHSYGGPGGKEHVRATPPADSGEASSPSGTAGGVDFTVPPYKTGD